MTLKTIARTAASLTLACTASAPFNTASADDFTGEKTLGLQAGYIHHNESAVAGIEFTYRFSRHFRLAPSAEYVFRNKDTDALLINVNAHFPFPFAGKWELYPLAGVNYSSWNHHQPGIPGNGNDVGSRVSRFGLNAGAGIGVSVTQSLKLGLSADYVFIEHFNGCNILAKIAYRF